MALMWSARTSCWRWLAGSLRRMKFMEVLPEGSARVLGRESEPASRLAGSTERAGTGRGDPEEARTGKFPGTTQRYQHSGGSALFPGDFRRRRRSLSRAGFVFSPVGLLER